MCARGKPADESGKYSSMGESTDATVDYTTFFTQDKFCYFKPRIQVSGLTYTINERYWFLVVFKIAALHSTPRPPPTSK